MRREHSNRGNFGKGVWFENASEIARLKRGCE